MKKKQDSQTSIAMDSKKWTRSIDDLMRVMGNDSKRPNAGPGADEETAETETCFQKVDTDRLQPINELVLSPELEASVRTL